MVREFSFSWFSVFVIGFFGAENQHEIAIIQLEASTNTQCKCLRIRSNKITTSIDCIDQSDSLLVELYSKCNESDL